MVYRAAGTAKMPSGMPSPGAILMTPNTTATIAVQINSVLSRNVHFGSAAFGGERSRR